MHPQLISSACRAMIACTLQHIGITVERAALRWPVRPWLVQLKRHIATSYGIMLR
jgi:hypothetical protein